MKKNIIILIVSLIGMLFPLISSSQDDHFRFGLFGSYNIYDHPADFRTLPGCPTCSPRFTDGIGAGMSAGLLFEIPLTRNLFLGLRAGYLTTYAQFTTDEHVIVNLNGNYTTGTFRHTLEADFGDLIFQPQIQWRFWNNFMLHGGFELAFGKFGNNFTHKEEIIEPTVGTFENNLRTRLNSSGEIKDINPLTSSVFAGLSYEFYLNKKRSLILAPELMFFLGLQDNVANVTWSTNSIRLGAALKFSPTKTHRAKDYKIDTIQIRSNQYTIATMVEGEEFWTERKERSPNNEEIIVKEVKRVDTLFLPKLYAKLITTAIADNGLRSKVTDIHISTQFVTEVFPVLPYVFFDKKSSQIPSRYEILNNTNDFAPEELEPNPVQIQRHVLNIIGKRMQMNPSTSISLLGAADPTSEGSDCNLASTRAQVVKNYLVRTWKIDENRITLKALSSPCNPSNITQSQVEDGYEDNRRVEIYSNDKVILESLQGKRFNEPYKITPPVIEHDPSGSSTEDIVNWVLIGNQGSNQLFTKSGEGAPVKIEHKLSNQTAMAISADMPIQLTYIIKDKNGKTATATEELNVTKDTSETEIKRLSLTVFNVGSADVTPTAKDEIRKFFKDGYENSEINITGYTDRLGSESFNQTLSANRAKSIAEFVSSQNPSAKINSTSGVAFNQYPPGVYSYSTPEERFLSRTVQIELRHKRTK